MSTSIRTVALTVCLLTAGGSSTLAQQSSTSPEQKAIGLDIRLVVQKLNDPGVQQRVGAAVQAAAIAQLAKEGVNLTPESLAELTAQSAKKKGDPGDTLAAGAVLIATIGMFSDERLKENVRLVGKSPSGIGVYEFSYRGYSTRWRGALAQDVQTISPDAVNRASNGYFTINYDRIDVPFESVAN